MRNAYLILGTNPELSWAEVSRFLSVYHPERLGSRVVQLAFSDDFPDLESYLAALVDELGGTIKTLIERVRLDSPTPQKISESVIEILTADQRKIVFSYVSHTVDSTNQLNVEDLKDSLSEAGRPSRYIESKGIDGVSAAYLLHSRCLELHGIWIDSTFVLAQTVGVQNIDAWTFRDRGKPYADHSKGMLPPKLARIMINLAFTKSELVANTSPKVLYDPFCGTGTVLLEAILSGYQIVGSDVDAKASEGTKRNLIWFAESLARDESKAPLAQFAESAKIFPADVVHVVTSQVERRIDAIVTEPFLGKQTPRPNQVDGMLKGLSKLYLGAFKQWRTLLQPGARVVMVWPAVQFGHRLSDLSSLIDKLQPWGYTLKIGPLAYARPGAVVQRQVMVFEWDPDLVK